MTSCTNTDEARYKKFVSGKKSPEPQNLPPTQDALLCHCKRVAYVTEIVKKFLDAASITPTPNGNGWIVNEDEELELQWMLRDPAPTEVLALLSCACKKSKCSSNACICRSHGLKCSELCRCCDECQNTKRGTQDESSEEDSSDEDISDGSVSYTHLTLPTNREV